MDDDYAISDLIKKLCNSLGSDPCVDLEVIETELRGSVETPRTCDISSSSGALQSLLSRLPKHSAQIVQQWYSKHTSINPQFTDKLLVLFESLTNANVPLNCSPVRQTATGQLSSTPADGITQPQPWSGSAIGTSKLRYFSSTADSDELTVKRRSTRCTISSSITKGVSRFNYDLPKCFLTGELNNNVIEREISKDLEAKLEADTVQYIRHVMQLSRSDQELAAMVDFLGVLQTSSVGNLIKRLDTGTWYVHPSVDPVVKDMTSKCLPLIRYIENVNRFIRVHNIDSSGKVLITVCSKLYNLVDDFLSLVVILDRDVRSGSCNLIRLVYQLQPSINVFSTLSSLCSQIEKERLRGGCLLTFLHNHSNDPHVTAASTSITDLLHEACVPYFYMLTLWLHFGTIIDPCKEFMIEESGSDISSMTNTDAFDVGEEWHATFKLKLHDTPVFLRPIAQSILKCGKYINFAASCNHRIDVSRSIHELVYDEKEVVYGLPINNLLNIISKRLMRLLFDEYKLMQRFKCVKQFFLIEQGDWLLSFLDTAGSELIQDVDDVLPHRMQALLDIAVRSSSVAGDPFSEQVKIEFCGQSLNSFLVLINAISGAEENVSNCSIPEESLRGIDAMSLQLQVRWPLAIVFTWNCMQKYTILFRRLLHCKYVESRLANSWIEYKKRCCVNLEDFMRCALRQQMLAFVQSYLFYCTREVVQPNWDVFAHSVETAHSVDDVVTAHNRLLDDVTKDCMLTDGPLVECVHKLLQLCEKFSTSTTCNSSKLRSKFTAKIEELMARVRTIGDGTTADSRNRAWMNFLYRLELSQIS